MSDTEKEEIKQPEQTEAETEAIEVDFTGLETTVKNNSECLNNINSKLEAITTTLNNLTENLNKPKKVIIRNNENKSVSISQREQHKKAMKDIFGTSYGHGR